MRDHWLRDVRTRAGSPEPRMLEVYCGQDSGGDVRRPEVRQSGGTKVAGKLPPSGSKLGNSEGTRGSGRRPKPRPRTRTTLELSLSLSRSLRRVVQFASGALLLLPPDDRRLGLSALTSRGAAGAEGADSDVATRKSRDGIQTASHFNRPERQALRKFRSWLMQPW